MCHGSGTKIPGLVAQRSQRSGTVVPYAACPRSCSVGAARVKGGCDAAAEPPDLVPAGGSRPHPAARRRRGAGGPQPLRDPACRPRRLARPAPPQPGGCPTGHDPGTAGAAPAARGPHPARWPGQRDAVPLPDRRSAGRGSARRRQPHADGHRHRYGHRDGHGHGDGHTPANADPDGDTDRLALRRRLPASPACGCPRAAAGPVPRCALSPWRLAMSAQLRRRCFSPLLVVLVLALASLAGGAAAGWLAPPLAAMPRSPACTGVSFASSPASPQPTGAQVTLTGSASGCPDPSPLYRYWVQTAPNTYQLIHDWTTGSATWNTNGLTPGSYWLIVWAKDAQSTTQSYDVDAGGSYTLSVGSAPGTVTLTSPANSATNTGTTPTFTWAAPTGAVSGTTTYTL